MWLTNFLPSAPLFEDSLYWILGSNPYASPLDYGEVLGGSIEQSMQVFNGQTAVQRLLSAAGLNSSKESWTVRAVTHFTLGFSLFVYRDDAPAVRYRHLQPCHAG